MATWRSGYAAVCKTVYTSSILVVASIDHSGRLHFYREVFRRVRRLSGRRRQARRKAQQEPYHPSGNGRSGQARPLSLAGAGSM